MPDNNTLHLPSTDDIAKKTQQQSPKKEEKPLRSEQSPQQLKEQQKKENNLPDIMAKILAGIDGTDKNYALAAAASIVYTQMYEISMAITKAWGLLIRQPLEINPKDTGYAFKPMADMQEPVVQKVTPPIHSLTLDPKEEDIRKQLLELSAQINIVTQRITGNLQQVAQTQAQFINQLQQTPTMQPLLGILQQATQQQAAANPTQSQPQSTNLANQFILDFASGSFDSRLWAKQNLPKEFRHDYRQAVDLTNTSDRRNLQLLAKDCRASFEEAIKNLAELTTLFDTCTQLLAKPGSGNLKHLGPQGGVPIEALRGLLNKCDLETVRDPKIAQSALKDILADGIQALRHNPLDDAITIPRDLVANLR